MPAASEVAKSGAPGQVLVAAEGVSIAFRGKPAVENVAIAVHASEIVTLIGPNGAGKTTLARALLGLAPVLAGRITRKPGLRIGYVPQRFPIDRIIPLSVRRFMSLSEAVPRERAAACLGETGAERIIDAQLSELSGGEFQRVLLARALARDPQLLVLDEPAQAVDFAGGGQLYELITAIRDNRGCGILLISHDLHVVLGASDRVVCLNRHVCCAGTPDAVGRHPEYVRLFGRRSAASLAVYSHRHDHGHGLGGEIVCSPPQPPRRAEALPEREPKPGQASEKR